MWVDLDVRVATGVRVRLFEHVFGKGPMTGHGSRRFGFSSSAFSPAPEAKRKTTPPNGQTNPCGQDESWSDMGPRSPTGLQFGTRGGPCDPECLVRDHVPAHGALANSKFLLRAGSPSAEAFKGRSILAQVHSRKCRWLRPSELGGEAVLGKDGITIASHRHGFASS